MNHALSKIRARLSFTEILYLAFFISIVCAFRAITSISTGLILVTGIIQHKPSFKSLFAKNLRNEFTAGCILFFLLQIVSLFFTNDMQNGWNDLRLKSGLVFLPLAILFTGYLNTETLKKLLFYYSLVVTSASLFLLCAAFNTYLQTHNLSSFFYYDLVKPFAYHPVYYSVLVFVALVFMLENFINSGSNFSKPLFIAIVIFLSLFLLLLSSKLVLSFYVVYLIYFLVSWNKKNKKVRFIAYTSITLIILISSIMLLTRNPVSDRFRDIVHGNINVLKQESFSPSVYFNGLQFRLLQWKIVPEILSAKHCWLTGVTAGDAQAILNHEYLSKNMYSGSPGRSGTGYLGYNTHSQFLESLLQNGIPGLIAFILICVSLIKIAWQGKKRLVSFSIILLLVYSLIESLFQEQYGIVILIFLSLFLNQDYKENKPVH
ncbi:MAG: O-antigen ligase family protein [Bacteroidota bacterium]